MVEGEMCFDSVWMKDSMSVFPVSRLDCCCCWLVEQFGFEFACSGESVVSVVHFERHIFNCCLQNFGCLAVGICIDNFDEIIRELRWFEDGFS